MCHNIGHSSGHVTGPHWTYWLQIHSKLCFQRVTLSENYKNVAISTDKNTFFNDLDYRADIGQHFKKKKKKRQGAPLSQNKSKQILKLMYLYY